MTIDFQYTLDDYRIGLRAHYRKGASAFNRWLMKLLVPLAVLSILLGVVLVTTGEGGLSVAPFVIGALWIWIRMGGSYQLSAKKQFAKNPVLREPRRMDFSDDGVKTDAGIASSKVSWKAYLRYAESKDCFLLYHSPVMFVIVPMRVLQPEQVVELRRLLQTHVAKDVAMAASSS